MTLAIERFESAPAFLDAAAAYLDAREAEHNLILGLTRHLAAHGPRPDAAPAYFAVARDGTRVVGAAVRTPPHQLLLSELDDAAAAGAFARDLRDVFHTLSGVLAAPAAAADFVRLWESLTLQRGRPGVRQRIYKAESAEPPGPSPPGRARAATAADRDLLVAWFEAFHLEAMPNDPGGSQAAANVDRRLAMPESGLVLWIDERDQPVSLLGFGAPTPNGMRIGPVYTPSEHRRRGYAGALTHEVTRMLLERGRRFCFLYTDLANPTSNAIYQRIGYRPVGDADQWLFA